MKRLIALMFGFIIFFSSNFCSAQQFLAPFTVSDRFNSIDLTIGIHPDGTDGFDPGLDHPLPPFPPPGAFDARLIARDESYHIDIRENTLTEKTFAMTYIGGEGTSTIALTWDYDCLQYLGEFIINDLSDESFVSLNIADLDEQLIIDTRPDSDDPLRIGLKIKMTPYEEQLITINQPIADQDQSVNFKPYIVADLDNVFGSDFPIDEPFIYSVSSDGNVIADLVGSLLVLSSVHDFVGVSEIIVTANFCQFSVLDTFLVFIEDVSIEEEVIEEQICILEQNYPNPLQMETTIKYRLFRPDKVELRIFDISGREIRTLISEDQNVGIHEIKWNRKNDLGNFVKSGLYIYRLKLDNETRFGKMCALNF